MTNPKPYDLVLLEMAQSLYADLGVQVDLVAGSSIERSLLEALAFQVSDLSERVEAALIDATPEAVFRAFGFTRRAAVPATGTLIFGVATAPSFDVYVPAGSEARSDDDLVFATTEAATLRAGSQLVSVPAACLSAGAAGNVGAYAVNRASTGVPGLSHVTNTAPFTGGLDEETPDAQLARFLEHLTQLDRSNLSALALAARTATDGQVTPRNVLVRDGKTEPSIPPGTFEVHAYRPGGVSDALQAAIEAQVDAYRAGGCIPRFTRTPGTPVRVTATVTTLTPGVIPDVHAALGAYFDALTYGQKASRENIITALSRAHPSVQEVEVISPAADVPCDRTARLELGSFTVQETVGRA